MRIAIALAITLVAGGMSPVGAASSEPVETVHHHNHHHTHHHHPAHRAERPAPIVVAPAEAVAPGLRPNAPGEGDTDGLSRDEDDCNKGCIGGNPQ